MVSAAPSSPLPTMPGGPSQHRGHVAVPRASLTLKLDQMVPEVPSNLLFYDSMTLPYPSHSRRSRGGAQMQRLPGKDVGPHERNPHLWEVRAG